MTAVARQHRSTRRHPGRGIGIRTTTSRTTPSRTTPSRATPSRATHRRATPSRISPHLIALALTTLAGLAGACAPATQTPEMEPETVTGWHVRTAEFIGLWYHGLAYTYHAVAPAETTVLPRFDPEYVERIVALKRREGVYPTPLDDRAAEFGRIFRSDEVYDRLEFLPLFFRDGEALRAGIDLWNRAGGNPAAAGSAEAARVIAFLSQLFPRPADRQTVVSWVGLLAEEDTAFYRGHWAGQAELLATRAAAVQREWDALAPDLSQYLAYIGFRDGEIFLTPALGPEGRTVTSGVAVPRVAVLVPPANHPAYAVWGLVHELLYPLVGDVVREQVAPARIRELGEARLNSLAAIRGGAILLQQTAAGRADRVDDYRRFFLESIGQAAPTTSAGLDSAFVNAFPLPPELVRGLEEAVDNALAGI